jgi:hypothetical protein
MAVLCCFFKADAATPQITSFTPGSGGTGSAVAIAGTNFDPVPANDVVYFGAVRATVVAATPTNLNVTVPVGATFAPITVTANGLTAWSKTPFLPTFAGAGTIDSSSFAPRLDLPDLSGSGFIAFADLDGDGKPDLVLSSGYGPVISIYQNISTNGTLTAGSFGPRVDITAGTYNSGIYSTVTVGDLDGDGRLDIIVVTDWGQTNSTISVLQNFCTPGTITSNSFGAPVKLLVAAGVRGVAAQDIDGDGKADIVTGNYDSSTISILQNIGTGGVITSNSFAPAVNFSTGTGTPQAVTIADLDGDGQPDIVTVNFNNNSSSNAVSIFRNISTPGTIALAPRVDLAGPLQGNSMAIGDMDGDGKADIVTCSFNYGQVASVYRNLSTPGSISFATDVDFSLGGWGNAVTIGDLDGDGKLDVAVAVQLSAHVSIFKNISTPGSFTASSLAPRVDLASSSNPYGVTIGDIDGDGRPELFFSNDYDTYMSIYQNVIGPPIPPTILAQPVNQTVTVGQTASFSVTASGTAPLSYQWSVNGTNIVNGTNATLILNNVQTGQAGNYSVAISNVAGSTNSASAVLTVPACTPPALGLVAWWPGQGNALDVIGGNNGSIVGSIAYTSGEVGQAFSLNGSSGYVSIPDSPVLDTLTDSITVECWIKGNLLTNNSVWTWIVTKGNSSWRIMATQGANTVTFYASGVNTPGNDGISGTRNVNDGQWHHIAGVYDGTNMFLYVDGTLDTSRAATGLIYVTGDSVQIGYNSAAPGGNIFNGLIDEVSLYHRALSASEIQAIYSIGNGGKCFTPVAPYIVAQPTNRTVVVGQTASFSVAAGGTPPLFYQWSVNGTNIVNGTNATLTLTNVQTNQTGNYSVVIANALGSTNSANALLTVYGLPPLITAQPANQTVAVGQTASFSVTASGTAPLSYQWSVNGTNIVNGTNPTLTLTNVQLSQAGNYSVAIANAYGSTNSSSAVLTVQLTLDHFAWAPIASPENAGQPFGVTITAQDQIGGTFSNFTGTVGLSGSVSSGGAGSTIVVTEIDPNTPDFTEFMNVSANSINISGWKLTIYDIDSYPNPLINFTVPTNTIVPSGGVFRLTEFGTSPGSYPNFYTGINIDWIASTTIPAAVLVRDASGSIVDFACVGSAVSTGISNPVSIPTNQWSGTSIPGNSNGSSNYQRTGNQDHNNKNDWVTTTPSPGLVNTGLTYPFAGGALNISISPTNTGNFINGVWTGNVTVAQAASNVVLVAKDGSGHTGSSNPFNVVTPPSPPTITQQPSPQTVIVGQSASFSVIASGTSPLSYQWSVNGTNIVNATNATLTLNNVQTSQAGNYSVAVANVAGSTNSANASLTVNSPSCTPPASGLVAWWQGEGNAQDVFGINNGVLQGGINFASGEVGQAFVFNNTNEDIFIPASSSLNVGTGNGFTLEAWINPTNASVTGAIFDWNPNDGTDMGVQFNLFPNGQLYANIVDTSGNLVPGHRIWTATGAVTYGAFQHVALAYDKASGLATIFCNGLVVTQQNLGTFTPLTSYNLYLGYYPLSAPWGTATFAGKIDEMSIYNRALSSSEIAAVYNAGSYGKCVPQVPPFVITQPVNQTVTVGQPASFSVTAGGTPPLFYQWSVNGTNIINATNATLTLNNVQASQAGNYSVAVANVAGSTNSANASLTVISSCTAAPSGLVSWWSAEGNANDIIGGNSGTLNGAGFTNGEVGQAFTFNGTSYVSVPDSSSLDGFTNRITIEAWVKVNSFAGPGWDGILTKGNSSWQLRRYGSSSTAAFSTAGLSNSDLGGQKNINDGLWHHIAGVYDGTYKFLYVDGKLDASVPATGTIAQNNYPVYIGGNAQTQGNLPGYFWNGLIDEVSIYNRALSSNEIAAIYNAGSYGKCVPQVPPFVITQPANQTVTVGQTAAFSVAAGGTSPLFYQWSVNGTNIVNGTNATLTLNNVQTSQAGNYSVAIANVIGSTNSANAALTVNLPTAIIQVVSTNALAGATVDVPVILVANGNENGLSFSLNFDTSRLTYSDIALGDGATDAYLLPTLGSVGSGALGVTLELPPGETFAAGTQQVVIVTFNAPILTGTQTVATVVSFTNKPINKLLSDASNNLLATNFIDGLVALSPSPLEGDASPVPNGDNNLDLSDLVQVGRFVVGADTITNSSEFQRVDCAPRSTLGDGQIDCTDWVQAGRYASGADPLTIAGGPIGPINPPSANAGGTGFKSNLSSRQVSIANGTGIKGLTVTVPVNLQAQGDENALGFSLIFDPTVVRYSSAIKGGGAGSSTFVVNTNQVAAGKLGIALALPPGSRFASGTKEVAKVTFVALAPATNYSVTFADQPAIRSISDTNANALPASYVNDSLVINPDPPVNITHSGNNLQFQWPVWAGGFVLQSADSLTPPVTWTNVPVTLQTNGNTVQGSVSSPSPSKYYRLYNPGP